MTKRLDNKFVEGIPQFLEEGVLYISIRFKTTSHLCACGCGERVVAKLSPEDWSLLYNGRDVSLNPSIGNWNFECRSHYFVRNNNIVWAGDMSEQQISKGRKANARRKKAAFAPDSTVSEIKVPTPQPQLESNQGETKAITLKKQNLIVRLWKLITGKGAS